MRVGIIVECAAQGIEVIVCRKVVQMVAVECHERIEPDFVPMTNKKLLLLGAADAAQKLLVQGCDRIVIMWDENPPWRPDNDFAPDRCWRVERDALLANCRNLQLDLGRIRFVCIEREFESWLLFDHNLICRVLKLGRKFRHKARPPRRPHELDWPKYEMEQLFKRNGRTYNASVTAPAFARNLESLGNLKRCYTFRYFVQCVLGEMPSGWEPCNYIPREARP